MTRFLLPLERAVDTIVEAIRNARRGETYIPRIPSSRVMDIATTLVGGRNIPIVVTGIRPGEKIHEIMVSEEEGTRTIERNGYYVIRPMLPEIDGSDIEGKALCREYSSGDFVMTTEETKELLVAQHLMPGETMTFDGEFLR
jgi:UDP-glucose 4-epimerase